MCQLSRERLIPPVSMNMNTLNRLRLAVRRVLLGLLGLASTASAPHRKARCSAAKDTAVIVTQGDRQVVLDKPYAAAQQTTTDDLKKEIESLRTMLQGMQKDLQELKGMMARQAPPPSGVGAVIDFGNSPIKGERTAKLTLVEFSDYQ